MAQSPARPTPSWPRISPDADDLPLGAQLAWRLRVLIASGQLAPGDRLPGVRELASGTGVNVNTARAVYGRLEDDGLIVSRHGLGTFVAEDAPASPELERLAAEAADSARASGVDPRDLARAIYTGSGPASQAATCSMPLGRARGRPAGDRASRSRGRRAARPARAAPPDRPPRGAARLLSRRRPQAAASRPTRCFAPRGTSPTWRSWRRSATS